MRQVFAFSQIPRIPVSHASSTVLTRLKAAVADHPQTLLDPASAEGAKEEGEERHASLAHRALPLIGLLEAAAAAKAHVLWESP
jgi:hypothetical protein